MSASLEPLADIMSYVVLTSASDRFLSHYSIISFCLIFFGYILQSSVMQIWYAIPAFHSLERLKIWKSQPAQRRSLGSFYAHPSLSNKPHRASYHRLFASINLVIASLFAAGTTELCYRKHCRLILSVDEPISLRLIMIVLAEFMVVAVYENVVEYYWHRMMHLKFFYLNFHKFHHHYKSPEPYDDMFIHPLEAVGYYCILYSPPFLFPIHLPAFLLYMVVMGLCGVIDHSGVRIEVPWIYNSLDHDNHHLKFNVNYGFPFIYLDILHGTYEGSFAGKLYRPKRHRSYDPTTAATAEQ
jgi:sterol desaturase/sphingolipid hydroxylase (fatty acid hydroxylase superfamily)